MFWDPFFDSLSAQVGSPPDQLKLIFSLLVSYPLGSLFVRLPPSKPNVAHLFSIGITTFFLVPLLGLGNGMLHLLASCVGTYAIVVTMRGKDMPWIAFIFVMGHLLINHIRRHFLGTPVTSIEITGSQMVLAMKLTTFAWNVHDGRQKSEVTTRLTHVPSPLAFLGYCFFFPSVLTGPSFDYATYDALVHHTIYNVAPPGTGADQVSATKRRVPYGRKRVAYLHLVIGLFFLGVYAVFGSKAGYERVLSPTWYTWGLRTRFAFVQLAGFIARTKYYAVWSLSEGACILTGIGFNGYDPKTGRTLWNRVRNINIISIESAESFKVLFDSWNCRTNVWLRDVVYKRLTKKGKKPGTKQSMATFVTSAFWATITPVAFVMSGVLTSLGRQFRHFVRPYFLSPATTPPTAPNSFPKYPYPNFTKRVYDIVGWAMVQINLNYVACPFILLSFGDCIRAWHRMGWYGHILVGGAMLFFQTGGRRALRRGLENRGLLQKSKPKEKGRLSPPPPSVRVSPPSPAAQPEQPQDEIDSSDLRWVRHALDNPDYQDGGVGVTPEAGLVDRWVSGAETPRSETPRPY